MDEKNRQAEREAFEAWFYGQLQSGRNLAKADMWDAWQARAIKARVVADSELHERDTSKPAEQQGLFRKFEVRRTDGSDAPGSKHHGCRYFVLDVDHDAFSAAALDAYAAACEATHPELASDLREKWGTDAMKRIAGAPVAQGLPDLTDERIAIFLGRFVDPWMHQGAEAQLRAILAQSAPRAEQSGAAAEMVASQSAEPVAEVLSSRAGNDTSTIDKAFPPGTKLYATPPAPASAQQAEPVANNEAYDLAYDKIDRLLRSNLDDDDYAEFSRALDSLFAAPAPASPAPDGQFLRDIILECAPVVGLKADEASAEEVLHLLRRKAEASASTKCDGTVGKCPNECSSPCSSSASPAALTDAKTLALGAMVDAMRWWGAQEDGIPAECKKAFDSAMLALGWSYSHPQDLKVLAASPVDQVGDARIPGRVDTEWHDLKADAHVFEEVITGRKASEIRFDDRGYQVGHVLRLRETRHTGAEMKAGAPLEYTGREAIRVVSHIQRGYGLGDGWVCLSFDAAMSASKEGA